MLKPSKKSPLFINFKDSSEAGIHGISSCLNVQEEVSPQPYLEGKVGLDGTNAITASISLYRNAKLRTSSPPLDPQNTAIQSWSTIGC
jgi:hypothetical protein